MARVALNKASLQREQRKLGTYRRFLPSLDLKRRQLIAEREKARRVYGELEDSLDQLRRQVGEQVPMLANREVELDRLVTVTGVELAEQNMVGTRLPVLRDVHLAVRPYGLLTRPHWVDRLVDLLKRGLELKVRLQVQARRVRLLEEAVRKITQRVNLFDKVLIPRTQENIRSIKLFLADAERAGVVRAKIAKGKRAREAAAEGREAVL